MVLHELGIPAVCPNSETNYISNSLLTELQKRFTYVVSFYDYDNAGITGATKLNIPYMFMFKTKDISDYILKYKKIKTFRALKKLISKSYHRHEKFLFHNPGISNAQKLKFDSEMPF
jgi:hypothetical protein